MAERNYTETGIVASGDIVTRLRDGADSCDSFCDVCTSPHVLAREAADEIERLRSEVDIKGHRVDDLYAEIEQLKTAGDSLLDMALSIRLGTLSKEDIQPFIDAWEDARYAR